MTNHVHFIAVPHTETSFARGFGEAHKRYTRMKNFSDNVRGYLFQGRFGSCVLDEHHLLAAVRYVENNPVVAGMAKHAWQYKWSSAAYHVGVTKKDVLVNSKNLYGLIKDWRTYLDEQIDGMDDINNQGKFGGHNTDMVVNCQAVKVFPDHLFLCGYAVPYIPGHMPDQNLG